MPFTYKDQAPNHSTPCEIVSILAQIMDIFFQKQIPNFEIQVSESFNCPICFRQNKVIQLSCDSSFWCQLSYQFAHEYFHLQIPNDICRSFRWFEESICELSSIFFMKRLSKLWRQERLFGVPRYADSIETYILNLSKEEKVHSFNICSLSDSKSEIYKTFCSNDGEYYSREMNRYIALCLLPIFERSPVLWTAVPFLSGLSDSFDLLKQLNQWKLLSPANTQSGISEIIEIFTPHNSN